MSGSSKARDTPPPSIIAGRYHVERVLGRGGMATVYLCRDSETETKVAVKVLRGELGSAVIVERFLREIEFASELDHPRVPKVLDSGVTGELPFYVMTYIEGESLRERLDRLKQLPVDEAVSITAAVIEPMTYAHRLGIIHRDIKPGNILVGVDGVYVLDFGIARAILASADERLTSTGVALGTPAYMSPEQALADQDLDARSDVYSLACVTYEMIAGIPPFVGATPQAVMARRFASPPSPLRETREGVPEHVDRAVAKALARAPADRWQTARQFADALSNATGSPSLRVEAVRLASRRRTYARAILGLVLIMITVSGAFAWRAMSRDYVGRSQKLIVTWDFPAAVEELRRGVAKRPEDPHTQLWLAQMLMLEGVPTSEWRPFALRAADGIDKLDATDKTRALALVEYSRESASDPCSGFRSLNGVRTQEEAANVASSLALAECLFGDRRVIPDPTTPSGFRFRASYERVASLYEGLAARNADNGRAYSFLMPRIEKILITSKNTLRRGTLPGEPDRTFIAWPSLVADTLTYVPVPIGGNAPISQNATQLDRVVERNVDKLMLLATAWTKAAPSDPDAHEALAKVLEASGRLSGPAPSSLDELRTARSTQQKSEALTPELMVRDLRLASTNIRVLLKLHQFAAAGRLADSTLSLRTSMEMSDSLQSIVNEFRTGIAALTGRAGLTIEIHRSGMRDYIIRLRNGEIRTLPGEIGADAISLSAYSAFGAPRDSIVSIANRLSDKLAALIPDAQLQETRLAVMSRPLGWAAAAVGPRLAANLGPTDDVYGSALRALAANDRRTAKRYSDSLTALYAGRAPGEVTLDAVLQRAWLRTAIGDTTGAIKVMDNALSGLTRAPPTLLLNVAFPAALVRVMILRAKLAAATGDSAASIRWTTAARDLWKNGDPEIVGQLNGLPTQ